MTAPHPLSIFVAVAERYLLRAALLLLVLAGAVCEGAVVDAEEFSVCNEEV